MNYLIKQLDTLSYGKWDQYVLSHSAGSVFHLTQWKDAIEQAFGHKTHYYYIESNGCVIGVFPMVQLKSLLFGNIISSLPFAAYGGPIANDDILLNKLLDFGKQLTGKLKGDYLDLKFLAEQDNDLLGTELYVTFIKEMSADHDENIKMIPRKQRAMVRKGISSGLTFHCSTDYLDDFYEIFAQNVQRMGTPVYGKKWFSTLLEVLGENVELHVVKFKEKVISGVLSFYYKDSVLPYYAASLSEYRHLAPNDFQYWMLMKHAVDKGCRYFDFGRSKKDTGPYKFKKHWGFEPQQLHYQYFLNELDAMPELNPMNPKYRLKIEAWKRLPGCIAKIVGPLIVKSIP